MNGFKDPGRVTMQCDKWLEKRIGMTRLVATIQNTAQFEAARVIRKIPETLARDPLLLLLQST